MVLPRVLSPQCLIDCSRGERSKSLIIPGAGAVVRNDQCIANLLTWILSVVLQGARTPGRTFVPQ